MSRRRHRVTTTTRISEASLTFAGIVEAARHERKQFAMEKVRSKEWTALHGIVYVYPLRTWTVICSVSLLSVEIYALVYLYLNGHLPR